MLYKDNTVIKRDISESNIIATTKEFKYDKDINEIPIEEVKGITQEEAEMICYDVLGDKDEVTGYKLLYKCIDAVENDDGSYYVIDVFQLVDGKHWSYIGNYFVSSDGSMIYEGMVKNSEYAFSDKIWNK